MTGREIRELLDHAGVLPSKQLGQNFLIDPNMSRWIVSQLEISPHDAVVEVGPGAGSLTTHLVGQVRKLILIEFDARLASGGQLCGAQRGLADMAIMPFVRQFAATDGAWFDAQPLPHLQRWLAAHLASDLFTAIMARANPEKPAA